MSPPLIAPMRRPLGQSGLMIPPVLWDCGGHLDQPILLSCLSAGLDAFFLPSDIDLDVEFSLRRYLESAPARPQFWIGARTDELMPRGAPQVRERLARWGRCAAVVLEDADISDLKGGRAFQRLLELRQDGLAQAVALQASDLSTAVWLLENSAAQALLAPCGLADPSALRSLAPAAKALGMGLVAVEPGEAIWSPPPTMQPATDLEFRLGEPLITAAFLSPPTSLEELEAIRAAIAHPPTSAQREALWAAFCAQVPAPEPPKRRKSSEAEG